MSKILESQNVSNGFLNLIAIEFKECLLNSPSFKASINHQVFTVETMFSKLDNVNFSLEDLDSWIYCDFIDNEIIIMYNNCIRPKIVNFLSSKPDDFNLLNSQSINNIKNIELPFKVNIGQFHQYQSTLYNMMKVYCVKNYEGNSELFKQDIFNVYTDRLKDLNNSLNLIHQLKIFNIEINIEIINVLISIIKKINSEKITYTYGEWIYSETIDKLQKLVANFSLILTTQQKLNKEINHHKNLIVKTFKNEYNPIEFSNNYEVVDINNKIVEKSNSDKELTQVKCWLLRAKKDKDGNEVYIPQFAYVKNNLFGTFQLSADAKFVTESDKFGLNLINFKLLDFNNKENNFRRYSFMLEFKDPSSLNEANDPADEKILFSVKFQCFTFHSLLEIYTVFQNLKAKISEGILSPEEKKISQTRFSPLFKEFLLEDEEYLINKESNDSISLIKKIEPYAKGNQSIDIEKALYCFNKTNLPLITSVTKLAVIGSAFISQGEYIFPNALTANTWGSEYWPSLYDYYKKDLIGIKTSLMSQLFIKIQANTDLTFQNVPFKTLFGHLSDEKAVLALHCFVYFSGNGNRFGSDMIFKSSIFATRKALYVAVNSYGFTTLHKTDYNDIIDMKLVTSPDDDNLEEPLTMIIYDKNNINMTVKINYVQYYQMKEQYTSFSVNNINFLEILSLVSFKEKVLFLMGDYFNNQHHHNRLGAANDSKIVKSVFNVKKTGQQDDNLKSAFYKIDYKYYTLNKKNNRLIFFQGSNSNKNHIFKVDAPYDKIEEFVLKNKVSNDKYIVSDIAHNASINIIEFKTSLLTKNDWSKIHRFEVPINIEALSLLILGKKNVLVKTIFKEIRKSKKDIMKFERDFDNDDFNDNKVSETKTTDKDQKRDNEYLWSKKNNVIYRHSDAVLKEKKVFTLTAFENTASSDSPNYTSNKIVLVEKILQYIPNENFIFKLEFGTFDIPILGPVNTNLYLIVERVPFSSNKSIVSFYFDLTAVNEFGNKILERLIFEILKNYLYKKQLKVMNFFKHNVFKFYKYLGNKGQYIQCLKIAGNIEIAQSTEDEENFTVSPIYLNRSTLAKLIIQHYSLKIIVLFFTLVKKVYLITGVLITNITLINKSITCLLFGSVLLNFFLFSQDLTKSYVLSKKINKFNSDMFYNNDKILLERSLTLNDLSDLVGNFSFKEHDKNNKFLTNFNLFKTDDVRYRSQKTKLGISRNKLLVELANLNKQEISNFNIEFENFVNYELDNCMAIEKIGKSNDTMNEIYEKDFSEYCQNVKNIYINKTYKEDVVKELL
ncbi:hypothetical protein QEN19_002904 [Hanseniaspora menglaensis]